MTFNEVEIPLTMIWLMCLFRWCMSCRQAITGALTCSGVRGTQPWCPAVHLMVTWVCSH